MYDVISIATEKKARVRDILDRNACARSYRNWLVRRAVSNQAPVDFDRVKAFETALVTCRRARMGSKSEENRERANDALTVALNRYPMPASA